MVRQDVADCSITIIAAHFGQSPPWIELFIRSCGENKFIDWVILTDCIAVISIPSNVTIIQISTTAFCDHVSRALGISFLPTSMYNICSIRPAFGDIFPDIISGYKYFGWCDVDVVFGRLAPFLCGKIGCNVITSSSRICSGHFTIFRNTAKMRGLYKDIPFWRELMSYPDVPSWDNSVDEAWLSVLCSPHQDLRDAFAATGAAAEAIDRYRGHNSFVEAYATPFVPSPWHNGDLLHPETWFWCGGKLTNAWDGDRDYPYLHLMNFKDRRYIDPSLYAVCPVWSDALKGLAFQTCMPTDDVCYQIDRMGIRALTTTQKMSLLSKIYEIRVAIKHGHHRHVSWKDIGKLERLGISVVVQNDIPFLLDPAGAVTVTDRAKLNKHSRRLYDA